MAAGAEDLGFGLSREPIPCPECGGDGGFLIGLPGGQKVPAACSVCQEVLEAREAQAERARQVDVALDRAGADRMRSWSFETYPADAAGRLGQKVAEDWLAAYVVGERRNLILWGNVGAGKTGLAWCMVRWLIEHDVDAQLVNFRSLLQELRLSFNERRQGLPTDYVRAHRVPVLALDDVGAERPTDFAREELANLVEQRYLARRPTIITSNYAMDDLARRLGHDDIVIGQRIVSRLTEGSERHEFKNRDRRLGG